MGGCESELERQSQQSDAGILHDDNNNNNNNNNNNDAHTHARTHARWKRVQLSTLSSTASALNASTNIPNGALSQHLLLFVVRSEKYKKNNTARALIALLSAVSTQNVRASRSHGCVLATSTSWMRARILMGACSQHSAGM